MEKKSIIRFIVTLQLLSLLFFTSCEVLDIIPAFFGGGAGVDKEWERIPKGLVTNVSGQFYDDNRNTPIVNAKVFIEEYIDDPTYDLTFSRYIDSTQTDQNGKFELPFTTTGAGVQYQLLVVPVGPNWYYPYNQQVIENIGGRNVLNSSSNKLSILEAKITVVQNPYQQPLMTRSNYDNYMSRVYGDSIVFYRLMPGRMNLIYFYTNSDTHLNYFDRGLVDTVNIEGDFSDTIRIELELNGKKFKTLN